MNARTDNPAEVGLHVFERRGLGKAPFRFVGCYEKRGPISLPDGTQIGSEGQAMGVCDYCGQGIAICCAIRSADGKEFTVGSDCVARTGDEGIVQQFKNSPDVRAMKRAKAAAKDQAVREKIAALLVEHDQLLKSIEVKKWDGSMESQFDYMTRVLPMCGASGRARYLKHIKTLIQSAPQ